MISGLHPLIASLTSLSARRAWIEINSSLDDILAGVVALRKESVDRNGVRVVLPATTFLVALRKESVDRNCCSGSYSACGSGSLSARRAWIEIIFLLPLVLISLSLSARRAWIEICCTCRSAWLLAVALRKESVDRNYIIKITGTAPRRVALRKESVDRN